MSEDKLDPDLKIHLSLDQIIRLDKSLNQAFKKKRRRKRKLSTNDHSVPLLSSLGGGFIYVSKNSPLLQARRRRLMEAERNRESNSDWLKVTKKVIPACYHLVKTDTGIEKVLLPIRSKTVRKKTKKKKGEGTENGHVKTEFNFNNGIPLTGHSSETNSDSMFRRDVNQSSANGSDDEIVVLYSSIKSQECEKREPMDVDSDSLCSKSPWSNVQCNYFVPQRPLSTTLNDRFGSIWSAGEPCYS